MDGRNSLFADHWLHLHDDLLEFDGVWDLLARGAGAAEIEQRVFAILKECLPSRSGNYGVILKNEDIHAQLLGGDDEIEYFYPTGDLACFDCMLLVRPKSIMNFLNLLSIEEKDRKAGRKYYPSKILT